MLQSIMLLTYLLTYLLDQDILPEWLPVTEMKIKGHSKQLVVTLFDRTHTGRAKKK